MVAELEVIGDPVGPSSRVPSRAVWLCMTLAAVVFTTLGLLVKARWSPIVDLDHEVSAQLVVTGAGTSVTVLRDLTSLGSFLSRVIIIGPIVIWLAVLHRWSLAAFAALTAFLVMPMTQLLKATFDRQRPHLPDTAFIGGLSFPSGHSSGIAAVVGILVVVTCNTAGWRVARWVLGIGTLLALAVGYTRIALGAHYFTDVIAGLLIGVVLVVVVAHVAGVWPVRSDAERTQVVGRATRRWEREA